MNKINYFALGVLCTVLLGSMFSFASAMWPFDVRESPGTRALVNAHQCNADDVCEVRGLTGEYVKIGGNNGTASLYADSNHVEISKAIKFLSQIRINTFWGVDWFLENKRVMGVPTNPDVLYIGRGNTNIMAITDSGVGIGAYNLIENYPSATLDVGGDIRATSLKGNGTAYVCVDAQGNLFRKATPCV